jgi:hypothetical protein
MLQLPFKPTFNGPSAGPLFGSCKASHAPFNHFLTDSSVVVLFFDSRVKVGMPRLSAIAFLVLATSSLISAESADDAAICSTSGTSRVEANITAGTPAWTVELFACEAGDFTAGCGKGYLRAADSTAGANVSCGYEFDELVNKTASTLFYRSTATGNTAEVIIACPYTVTDGSSSSGSGSGDGDGTVVASPMNATRVEVSTHGSDVALSVYGTSTSVCAPGHSGKKTKGVGVWIALAVTIMIVIAFTVLLIMAKRAGDDLRKLKRLRGKDTLLAQ